MNEPHPILYKSLSEIVEHPLHFNETEKVIIFPSLLSNTFEKLSAMLGEGFLI